MATNTRQNQIEQYLKRRKEHDDYDNKLRDARFKRNDLKKQLDKTEEYLKAQTSVGQIIGEILKEQEPGEKYLIKASSGPRYVVGCRKNINVDKLKVGARITQDTPTMTIIRVLPKEVDPLVHKMLTEDPGKVTFDDIGGLYDQIRMLRECIELPITNPELFKRVGIKAPKGVQLYGPPGTGKTLIARGLAYNVKSAFMKVVASGIVDKYIGESARVIREMFGYAKDHQPCIIFIDEIDAIGGRRMSEGSSSDREIQRTLMELQGQLDGFDEIGQVKTIMATNRPDTLDPALLRPGRLDRKVEIPLPNEIARQDIQKIHARPISKYGEIDFDGLAKLAEEFNGADLRNVCTEAGMYAIRNDREYVIEEDFFKAVRKIKDQKKLETKMEYAKL